ncbi:MAG TPA: cation:proton antiporter, partial [Robiginitalea sp.]|nr:cation:proton antiporter [Robiginitalea sp.]
ITLVSARYLVPRLMHLVARTGSKELFLITTITLCFAVAFLTSEAGLSLALGAFLAGLIISESEYSHQATSIILPFRELFTSFFFISVGMLLNLAFFAGHLGPILLIVLGLFVVKSLLGALAVAVLRYPPRIFLLTGLALFQVGEFAFILSRTGIEYGLLSPETNQYFLAVSIISMLLTPFVIIFSENIAFGMMRLGPIRNLELRMATSGESPPDGGAETLNNHLIIVGYGINGSNLARAAEYGKIPYVVLELDAERVQQGRMNSAPVVFGDASQDHMLELVHLSRARIVVIAISDPVATKVIIRKIRAISQSVHLIVRTRYIKEIQELLALGADDVIPEEFETSLEIFSRTLHNFLVPANDIELLVQGMRSDNYSLLQGRKPLPHTFRPTNHPEFSISCLKVGTDRSAVIGKTLGELQLRNRFGINVLGISRKGELISNILPSEKIFQSDLLYITGGNPNIDAFRKLIE